MDETELYDDKELLGEDKLELRLEEFKDDELEILLIEEELDSAKTFGLKPPIKPSTRLDKIIDNPAKKISGFLFDFLYINILKIIIIITFLKINCKQNIKPIV
jgi:hypothetical protein